MSIRTIKKIRSVRDIVNAILGSLGMLVTCFGRHWNIVS